MAELVGGKYEIEGTIGRGGMGEVFAARNTMTGRRVAIKRLLPHLAEHTEAVERFLREARAAGAIVHKNIVAVLDAGRDGDDVFIVMEHLQGEALSDRLKQGVLSPAEVVPILQGVLRGMAAAHNHNVIHRDIKPENIFLSQDSDGLTVPKVLDFGISKIAEESTTAGLTNPGSLLGTIQYMSPEQVRNTAVDHRSDVYALGVMTYRMLTGKYPFSGTNLPDISLQIMSSTAAPPSAHVPGLPPALDAVVMKAFARDPAQRFQSAEEFEAALMPFAGLTVQPSGHPLALHPSDSGAHRNPLSTPTGPHGVSGSPPTPTPFGVETDGGRARATGSGGSTRWLWPLVALVSIAAGAGIFLALAGDDDTVPAAAKPGAPEGEPTVDPLLQGSLDDPADEAPVVEVTEVEAEPEDQAAAPAEPTAVDDAQRAAEEARRKAEAEETARAERLQQEAEREAREREARRRRQAASDERRRTRERAPETAKPAAAKPAAPPKAEPAPTAPAKPSKKNFKDLLME